MVTAFDFFPDIVGSLIGVFLGFILGIFLEREMRIEESKGKKQLNLFLLSDGGRKNIED